MVVPLARIFSPPTMTIEETQELVDKEYNAALKTDSVFSEFIRANDKQIVKLYAALRNAVLTFYKPENRKEASRLVKGPVEIHVHQVREGCSFPVYTSDETSSLFSRTPASEKDTRAKVREWSIHTFVDMKRRLLTRDYDTLRLLLRPDCDFQVTVIAVKSGEATTTHFNIKDKAAF